MKRLTYALLIAASLFPLSVAAQGISQLQQFTSTTSPAAAITQTVFGKAFRLSGQTSGCAQFSANGTLTSTGVSCGTGSGGSSFAYPFPSNATSTSIAFNGGLTGVLTGSLVGNASTVTNGVYTTTFNGLFDNRLSATTTLPNLTTLANLGTIKTSLSGLLKAASGVLSAASNGTDYTLITAKTCTAGDFVSAVTAAGVFTCTTPAGTTYTGTYPIVVSGSAISFAGLATTSPWTAGQLAYVNANNRVTSVATGTVSASTGISVTAGQSIIGSGLTITNTAPDQTVALTGSGGTATSGTYPNFTISSFGYPFASNATSTSIAFNGGLTGTLTGTLVGNASTATALAANGTNCSAGNYPLGVDASGNAESCTAAGGFSYPFPSNATSTLLTFNAGVTATGATSTFAGVNISTQGLTIGTLLSCNTTSALTTDGSGKVLCGSISGSGGSFAYPFPSNATSTSIAFSGGLTGTTLGLSGAITSTATGPNVLPYASTTALSVSGLTSGNCVQASTGGLLTTTGSACGSGGSLTGTTGQIAYFSGTNTAVGTSSLLIAASGRLTNLNGDVLGQQAVYIVSTSTVSGQFTDVQSAIDALPSTGGLIHVRAGTYTLPTGNVGIQPKVANTIIEGEGNATQFNFNRANTTNAYEPAVSNLTGLVLRDVYIHQTNATYGGIGINASNTPLFIADRIKVDQTATSTSIKDTANLSFYQRLSNLDLRDNTTCIDIGGNPVNDNSFINVRCGPKAGNKGFGFYIDSSSANGAQANTIINANVEPIGSGTGITGIYCNNCVANTLTGSYIEGTEIAYNFTSNSQNNNLIGGIFLSNTTYTNNGSSNQFNFRKEGNAFNQIMASSTIQEVTGNDAAINDLSFRGNTNFAKVGNIIDIKFSNGSDTGKALNIVNPGSGDYLTANNGTTNVFRLTSAGIASTTNLTVSSFLTNRIPYTTTGGAFTTASGLAFDGTILTATFASTTNLTASAGAWLATASGNVGIGTTTPWAKLGVQGIAGSGAAIFDVASSSQQSYFRVLPSGTTTISGATAATSTSYFYSTASGKGAELIMEDEGGAACTRITTKAGVVKAAVVTCPPEI